MRGRLTRRQLIGAAGAGAAGAAGAAALATGRDGGGGGERPEIEGPRNVVVIVVDTLRADHLGCYGSRRVRTPNIDALAEGSLRFTRIFPEAMPTIPARRSMLTGRRIYPFRDWHPWLGLGKSPGWEPIRRGTPTLVTEMGRRGYHTACVTDNPFFVHTKNLEPFREALDEITRVKGQVVARRSPETVSEREARRYLPANLHDEEHIQGIRRYITSNGGQGGRLREDEISAARVFRYGVEALRRLGGARRRRGMRGREPFLLWVDSFDPHEPWLVPPGYLDLYRDPGDDGPPLANIRYSKADELTEPELARLRATYAGAVTMVDRWIGHLLDELERQRLDRDTVVLLVSDHGFHLGERDWVGKSAWHLFPELIHVPLLIRDPDGRGAGTTSDWLASTHDIAPTLLSLGGARPSRHFEGADLSPILDGGEPEQERTLAYGGYSNQTFVRDDRWALVVSNDRRGDMLFDLESDPEQRNDISEDNQDVVGDLYERVVAEIGGRPPWYPKERMEAEPRELPGVG